MTTREGSRRYSPAENGDASRGVAEVARGLVELGGEEGWRGSRPRRRARSPKDSPEGGDRREERKEDELGRRGSVSF